MAKITITITEEQARRWTYYLRRRYGKDKRTPLNRLAKIAVLREVSIQANAELRMLEAKDV